MLLSAGPPPKLDQDLPILVMGKINGLDEGKKGPYAYVRVIAYHDWKKSLQPESRRLTRDLTISLQPPTWFGPKPQIGDVVIITDLTNGFGPNKTGQLVERWQGNLARLWEDNDHRFFDKRRPKSWPVFPNQAALPVKPLWRRILQGLVSKIPPS